MSLVGALLLNKNALFFVIYGALAVTFAAKFVDGTLFGYHPPLMVAAYVWLLASGVIAGFNFRALPPGPARLAAIKQHAWTQATAVVLAFAGFYFIYTNKFGLATLILTLASPLLGAVSFKAVGLLQRLPESAHAPVKAVHRRLGTLTWALSVCTIFLVLGHSTVRSKGVTFQVGASCLVAAGALAVAATGLRAGEVGAGTRLPTTVVGGGSFSANGAGFGGGGGGDGGSGGGGGAKSL